MKVNERFTIGNNTFYINKKLNIIIIDEHGNNSESSVYINIDDFEDFIEIYKENKKDGE